MPLSASTGHANIGGRLRATVGRRRERGIGDAGRAV